MLAALRREMRGIAIALLLVAATTAVALFLRHYVGILRGAVLYLVPVMLAGYQLGVIPALVTAVAGIVLSGYLYFAPLYSFQVASPQEALNLMLFMVVAVVVSHLSSQAKQHILIARKREREMSDLYAFSRRLARRAARPRYSSPSKITSPIWCSARWCCSAPPTPATAKPCRKACAQWREASSMTRD